MRKTLYLFIFASLPALASASFFLPKEYLIDLHPSKADFEMFNFLDAKGG